MRSKDIIKALQQVDEQTGTRLGEEYLSFSEEEQERLLHRIEARITKHPVKAIPPETPEYRPSRLAWLPQALTASACVLVFGGTFAGLFWLKAHAPVVEQDFPSVPIVITAPVQPHTIGERYAADNLTASGTLWMTVTAVKQEDGLCRVDLALESDNAVSYAADSMGEPDLFFADNFRLTAEDTTISPCRMQSDAASGLPYTFTLRSGKTCVLSLWYPISDTQPEWKLIAGSSPDAPYTIIRLEE